MTTAILQIEQMCVQRIRSKNLWRWNQKCTLCLIKPYTFIKKSEEKTQNVLSTFKNNIIGKATVFSHPRFYFAVKMIHCMRLQVYLQLQSSIEVFTVLINNHNCPTVVLYRHHIKQVLHFIPRKIFTVKLILLVQIPTSQNGYRTAKMLSYEPTLCLGNTL